jgi:general secretion pathway protein C
VETVAAKLDPPDAPRGPGVTSRKSFLATIAPMWRALLLQSDWAQRAPRWSAVVLAGVIAADLTHLGFALRGLATPIPARAITPSAMVAVTRLDPQRIVQAHLFGNETAAPGTVDPAAAPETRLALELSGIIATRDPTKGFAILGEKGKASHLYSVGAPLRDTVAGRLYQIFADRVVLDLEGRLETLKLPRKSLPGAPATGTASGTVTAAAATAPATDGAGSPDTPTPAANWFGMLYPQRLVAGGIKLRPDMRVRREYDLRIGDVLNAVNGVEISGPHSMEDVQEVLKTSGKSLQLTVTRDGIQQTLTVPVPD